MNQYEGLVFLNIIQTNQNSVYLDKVKSLWRKNSSTLGFFPDGAFQEYANKKQILVGLTEDQELFGYLIYRISKMKVGIIHLCIDPKFRGKGLTKKFIDSLKGLTIDYQGIFLRCRRDYSANDVWPKLGFVPIDENIGKSIEGKPLCYWWYDYGHPTLFSEIKDDRKVAVMDANVFFDLTGGSDCNEVNALLSDFIQGEIKLCLTEEIFNEIHRNKEPEKRELARKKVYQFALLKADISEVDRIQTELNSILPPLKKRSDFSDRKQLSHAIAKNASFFVTRDEELLEQTPIIFSNYGIRITRPSTLIIHIDEMLRQAEYQPQRLAGSAIQLQRISSEKIEEIIDVFRETSLERKASFKQQIVSLLSDPKANDTFLIKDKDNKSLALFSMRKLDSVIEIPILRIVNNKLSTTLVRHLLNHIVVQSIKLGFLIVKLTENFLAEDFIKYLPLHGFIRGENFWIKICLSGIYKTDEIIEAIKSLGRLTTENKELISFVREKLMDIDSLGLERILWPLKIYEMALPTYIVPIKSYWAMHLFDEELANRSLFGAEASLALNVENAYYTAKCLRFFRHPARILWYVSEDKNHPDTKSLRACSLVTEVNIGKPKELYRKYQHYGIFEWPQVFDLAKKDINREIMGFQFCNTEQFRNPIDWKLIQRVLAEEGCHSTFQSITKISHDSFLKLYKLGIEERGE